LYVALQLLNTLKLLAYPFLPFSSEKLHSLLGYPGGDAEKGTYSGVAKDGEIVVPTTAKWEFEDLAVGQQLSKPEILFTKLDPSVAEEELARLQLNTLL
jgi:methionyl-tRNA synthetase